MYRAWPIILCFALIALNMGFFKLPYVNYICLIYPIIVFFVWCYSAWKSFTEK